MDDSELSGKIIGAAIEVHRELGPGLLEAVYRECLHKELSLRGLHCAIEVPVRAHYKGLDFDTAYRLDILVEDSVVVELKVAEQLLPVHHAQVLSYLRLTGKSLGLLMNFHVPRLSTGVRRIVNNL